MKWFRNKEMMQDILEQCKKQSRKSNLMKDHINLLQDHLELLDENEKLKKAFKLVTDIYLMNYWDIAKKLNNNIINKQEYELLKEVLNNESRID